MAKFMMEFILTCQREYNDRADPIDRFFPLDSDPEVYKLLKKKVAENLTDPDKIDFLVSNYDLFPTQTHKKWRGFIELLKIYLACK